MNQSYTCCFIVTRRYEQGWCLWVNNAPCEEENKILQLTQELEDLQHDHHHSIASVTTSQSTTAPSNHAMPPQLIDTVAPPPVEKNNIGQGEISYTMNAKLEKYDV